jgi:hypothetical protein
MEHNFKFLVLLPLEANEKIETLKQYYGVTHEGRLRPVISAVISKAGLIG